MEGEGRGTGEKSRGRGGERRVVARPRRPFPSSCIRPVSSTRLGRTTQRSASQRRAGHDWIRPLHRKERAARRDGMGWRWAGNSRAVRLARLGPCTSEQPCKARLPACQPGPVALRLAAAACSLQPASKRAGGFGACLLAFSAARLWIDSCEDGNR